MSKGMISVRIPTALLEELKEASKKDHFLDTSEAVRSIIRARWMKQKDPMAYELTRLRKDISKSISSKSQEDVLDELRRIRDSLLGKKE